MCGTTFLPYFMSFSLSTFPTTSIFSNIQALPGKRERLLNERLSKSSQISFDDGVISGGVESVFTNGSYWYVRIVIGDLSFDLRRIFQIVLARDRLSQLVGLTFFMVRENGGSKMMTLSISLFATSDIFHSPFSFPSPSCAYACVRFYSTDIFVGVDGVAPLVVQDPNTK